MLELALLDAVGCVHKELTTEWGRRGLSTHGLVEATLSGFLKSRSMIRHPAEILTGEQQEWRSLLPPSLSLPSSSHGDPPSETQELLGSYIALGASGASGRPLNLPKSSNLQCCPGDEAHLGELLPLLCLQIPLCPPPVAGWILVLVWITTIFLSPLGIHPVCTSKFLFSQHSECVCQAPWIPWIYSPRQCPICLYSDTWAGRNLPGVKVYNAEASKFGYRYSISCKSKEREKSNYSGCLDSDAT